MIQCSKLMKIKYKVTFLTEEGNKCSPEGIASVPDTATEFETYDGVISSIRKQIPSLATARVLHFIAKPKK